MAAFSPQLYAQTPPIFEDLYPGLVLEKVNLHLHLFAIGDPALETVRMLQDCTYIGLIPIAYRFTEFPVDHEVRQIGAKAQFWHQLQYVQGVIQIVEGTVPVGLDE